MLSGDTKNEPRGLQVDAVVSIDLDIDIVKIFQGPVGWNGNMAEVKFYDCETHTKLIIYLSVLDT